jgi:hypothetical protein
MSRIRVSRNTIYVIGMTLFPIFSYTCNNPNESESRAVVDHKKADEKANEYVEREKHTLSYLDSHNLLQLNDTAKWWLYNIFCDDTVPKIYSGHNNKTYLSFLNLYALAPGWSADSTRIEIAYAFVLDDTIELLDFPTKFGPMPSGVTFDVKTKKVLGLLKGLGGYVTERGEKSRYEYLLQPEVLTFVKAHKDSLNKWYLDALKRHGVAL